MSDRRDPDSPYYVPPGSNAFSYDLIENGGDDPFKRFQEFGSDNNSKPWSWKFFFFVIGFMAWVVISAVYF
ncbi:hypothetical protein [Sphingomonas sp. VNH70]|uniref:hypothetical protein n=1 Tax=Sphingomonas silueang TaxID=3156617 RepID=UPI0032B43314